MEDKKLPSDLALDDWKKNNPKASSKQTDKPANFLTEDQSWATLEKTRIFLWPTVTLGIINIAIYIGGGQAGWLLIMTGPAFILMSIITITCFYAEMFKSNKNRN